MTAKCSVFIATSLDGFIARTNGSIDWLETAASRVSGDDYGYRDFFKSIDAIVMGRLSFETALSFPTWPYGKRDVVVLTRTLPSTSSAYPDTVTTSSEDPATIITRLTRQGLTRFYIDGGKTIQSFLKANLIDELIITIVPVLLGEGIPLFGPLGGDVTVELVSSKSYPCGFVQNRYRVTGRREKS